MLNLKLGTNPNCGVAVTAASSGQAILVALGFNGTDQWLKTHSKLSASDATNLNNYANTLDKYNNDSLSSARRRAASASTDARNEKGPASPAPSS